jgi:hypothetical protein
MIRARWVSAVRLLIPSRLPISFMFFPSAMSVAPQRSRVLSGLAGADVRQEGPHDGARHPGAEVISPSRRCVMA